MEEGSTVQDQHAARVVDSPRPRKASASSINDITRRRVKVDSGYDQEDVTYKDEDEDSDKDEDGKSLNPAETTASSEPEATPGPGSSQDE